MTNRDNRGGSLTRRPEGTLSQQNGHRMLFGNPWREMEEMQRRMDALFSQVFGFGWPDTGLGRLGGDWDQQSMEPDVDIFENNDEYIFHAALPGVNPEDIQVQATDTSIMVTAQSRSPFENQEAQGGQNASNQQSSTGTSTPTSNTQAGTQPTNQPMTQHRQSRYSRQSRFEFSYTLPEEIKPNEVKASFRNGRLELHLPKSENAPSRIRPVSIPVEGATQKANISSGTSTQGMGTSGMTGATTNTGAMTGLEHQRRDNQTTPNTGQTQQSQPVTTNPDRSGQS